MNSEFWSVDTSRHLYEPWKRLVMYLADKATRTPGDIHADA